MTSPTARVLKRATPLESKLIARILLKPELALQVPEEALHGTGPEAASLRAVAAQLRASAGLTHGQALAYFEHSEHASVIEEALGEPLLHQAEGSELDLDAEVADLVEKLRGQHQARRSKELLGLVAAETATPEELAEYQELQAQLASSKAGNPELESRSKP